MKIVKLLFRVVLILVFLYFFFSFFFAVLSRVNSLSSQLMCENTLKMIANAAKLYQDEWEEQWPPSLIELGPYYEGKYNPGPNSIPKCPGNRNEQETHDSSEYYYYPPKVDEVVPVCWDSIPHYNPQEKLIPSVRSWNVLYSDGHIERFNNERELFRELFLLAKTNPDVLKVLYYPDDKISYVRLAILITGIVIGFIFAMCYRFVTKNKEYSIK